MAAIAIAAAAALIAASLMNLPRCIQVLRLDEHAAMWRSGKEPMQGAVMPRILESGDGEAIVEVEIPAYGSDMLHLAAEAALAPAPEGFSSAVPEGTRLIGAAQSNGYAYIDLSEEMEGAPAEAFDEIRRTIELSLDLKQICFMIEGSLVEE